MPIYQNLRRYLLLLLFISPAINSIAQDRSWYPTFERFEITPHPAYSGHIKTQGSPLFRADMVGKSCQGRLLFQGKRQRNSG